MNKASAIAFVVVLLFVGIAGYLVYSNIRNDLPALEEVTPREDQIVQSPTVVVAAETVELETRPAATAVPTQTDTPVPSFIPTETLPTSTPTKKAGPTIQVVTPTIPPTLTPRSETRTATPTEEAGVPPTGAATAVRTPAGQYAFYLDGEVVHDPDTSCVAQYIRGMVRNKAGEPLEGIRIKAFDLWGNEAMTTSKGGADIGKWDIVLGSTENIWKVVVVSDAGVEISPIAVVPHHQEGEAQSACVHIVNWRRAR